MTITGKPEAFRTVRRQPRLLGPLISDPYMRSDAQTSFQPTKYGSLGMNQADTPELSDSTRWAFINQCEVLPQANDRRPMRGNVDHRPGKALDRAPKSSDEAKGMGPGAHGFVITP